MGPPVTRLRAYVPRRWAIESRSSEPPRCSRVEIRKSLQPAHVLCSGTRCTALSRMPLRWARSGSSRSPPMPHALGSSGPIGAATPTCARHGFVPAMMCSAILLFCLPPPGVFGTGTGWPDIIVAAIMAGLALQGALLVMRQSFGELRQPHPVS